MTNFLCFLLVVLGVSSSMAELCKICQCENSVIQCQRQGFESYPSTIGVTVEAKTLDLSFNKIAKLDRLDRMDSLKSLILHHNEITSLEVNTFETFTFLDALDLSHNNIMNLETLMLKGLENLKILNLSQNDFRTLPNDIFYEMTKLYELRLSGNPLHFVRYEMFAKSVHLAVLDLSEIATDFLPNDIFHQLVNLEELDLSGNNFDEVPTKAIKSAGKLKILRLSRNPIKILDEYSFKKISSLEIIEMEEMPLLEEVKIASFSSLKDLNVLRIRKNPHLRKFNMGAITDLYNSVTTTWSLEELDLKENALETIDFPSEIVCKIDVLDLQGNKWNCDCHLHWLSECEIRPELTKELTCLNPTDQKGKNIRHLNTEQMICINRTIVEHQQRIMRTVVIACGLAGIFVCGIIIILVLKKRQIKEWWFYKKRGPGAVYYVRAQDHPKESISTEA